MGNQTLALRHSVDMRLFIKILHAFGLKLRIALPGEAVMQLQKPISSPLGSGSAAQIMLFIVPAPFLGVEPKPPDTGSLHARANGSISARPDDVLGHSHSPQCISSPAPIASMRSQWVISRCSGDYIRAVVCINIRKCTAHDAIRIRERVPYRTHRLALEARHACGRLPICHG